MITLRAFVIDAAERVFFTFVETFLALYAPVIFSAVSNAAWAQMLDLSLAQKAAVAGLAAVFVVLKSVAASFVGDTQTAGFLPGWLIRLLGIVTRVEKEDKTITEVTVTNPLASPSRLQK